MPHIAGAKRIGESRGGFIIKGESDEAILGTLPVNQKSRLRQVLQSVQKSLLHVTGAHNTRQRRQRVQKKALTGKRLKRRIFSTMLVVVKIKHTDLAQRGTVRASIKAAKPVMALYNS